MSNIEAVLPNGGTDQYFYSAMSVISADELSPFQNRMSMTLAFIS